MKNPTEIEEPFDEKAARKKLRIPKRYWQPEVEGVKSISYLESIPKELHPTYPENDGSPWFMYYTQKILGITPNATSSSD